MNRAHYRIAAFLLLAAVTARAADSVEARLNAKEKELEQLYAEYWRTDYRIALGEKNLSILPVKKRIRAVVSDRIFFRRLQGAHFSNPVLARRRELFLREAIYTNIFADPQLAALVEGIERDEDVRLMLAAMETLQPRYQQALTLRYLGGMSADDAAEAMGCTNSVLAVTLHRALGALRRAMERAETTQ